MVNQFAVLAMVSNCKNLQSVTKLTVGDNTFAVGDETFYTVGDETYTGAYEGGGGVTENISPQHNWKWM